MIMSIRDSVEYRELTPYLAVGYAEGFEQADSDEQVLAAWQYIYDKCIYHTLQGFFGRTIARMLVSGEIEK